jgi:lipid-binding SYLF domain-containing protein
MRNDLDENRELYRKRLTNKQILTRRMLLPHSARPLITLLNQYTERERRS